MKKRSYTITMDEFMDFWDQAKRDPTSITPDLTRVIWREWKDQIRARFNEYKKNRTFGTITMDQLAQFAQMFASPIRDKDYSPNYIRGLKKGTDARIFTFVKTGELREAMNRNSPYQEITNAREMGLKITIPFKTRGFHKKRTVRTTKTRNVWQRSGTTYNLRNTYRILETKRSFIKSSFLQAWPVIFEDIMDMLRP